MNMDKFIKKVLEYNNWLNGFYDYQDGDLSAPYNMNELFSKGYTEYKDIDKLYIDLKNYDGIFKFKNLVFFKYWNYGTFVYDINEGYKDYIEHLTMESISFKDFVKIIKRLVKGKIIIKQIIKIGKKTYHLKDFDIEISD